MRAKAWRRLGAALATCTLASLAFAKVDRVLHEPIPEELYAQGHQPPARAGEGSAGDSARAPSPASARAAPPNHGEPAKPGEEATFTIDRDTRRPDVLPYEDPFRPSVAPFKRLHAYDTINDAYVLSESGEPREEVVPTSSEPSALTFDATLSFDAEAGVAVRIPTPGPDAHWIDGAALHNGKKTAFVIRRDHADNWDLTPAEGGKIRFSMRVAVSSEAFGGDFGEPRWTDLPNVVPLPPRVAANAALFARELGVARTRSVRENITQMVGYFRSFQESEAPTPAGADIYLDLARGKKGVCRHRAFAFFVTARGLGIPTRMLTNEAHAWVEVHNGKRWKRIDLGGAGGALANGVEPPMVPPPDPFAWPEHAARGSDLPNRVASPGGGAGPSGERSAGEPSSTSSSATSTTTDPSGTTARDDEQPTLDEGMAEPPSNPAAEVEIRTNTPTVKLGSDLHVQGKARVDGRTCANAKVVVSLREVRGRAAEHVLGTLSTNAEGAFEGSLSVPKALPPGDYRVVAETPGHARCNTPQGAR